MISCGTLARAWFLGRICPAPRDSQNGQGRPGGILLLPPDVSRETCDTADARFHVKQGAADKEMIALGPSTGNTHKMGSTPRIDSDRVVVASCFTDSGATCLHLPRSCGPGTPKDCYAFAIVIRLVSGRRCSLVLARGPSLGASRRRLLIGADRLKKSLLTARGSGPAASHL